MAKLLFETQGTIFNKGKQLSVLVECYKTVIWVYLVDKTKYFPVVDKFKITSNKSLTHHDLMMEARRYALIHDLF